MTFRSDTSGPCPGGCGKLVWNGYMCDACMMKRYGRTSFPGRL